MSLPPVRLATVLPGAVPFREGNINETYRGQVLHDLDAVSTAVIKDLEQKELANELIAFVLARALGLPVPTAYLAQADDTVLPASKGPVTNDGRRLVLASTDVSVPNVMFRYNSDVPGRARLLGAITAWPQLGKLYGLDAWVANTDRHAGNLLFGSGAEAWLIDHGWAFTGPSWSGAELDKSAEYRHRLQEWLTPYLTEGGREARCRQAAALEADLKSLNLDDALEASHAQLLLAVDELRMLREFLIGRIDEVARLAARALELQVMI